MTCPGGTVPCRPGFTRERRPALKCTSSFMSTSATSLEPRQSWSARGTRISAGLLALAGFVAILAWAAHREDLAAITRDFAALGTAIGWIVLLHVVVIACDAAAWRALVIHAGRAPALDFLWARWVREATNTLLPVAQIGGEVVGARVLALRGVPVTLAGGSVVLDKLAEALSQIPFTLLGLLLILMLRGDSAIAGTVASGLFIAVAGLGALLLLRRAPLFAHLANDLSARLRQRRGPLQAQFQRFAQAVRAIYSRERFASAIGWHLLGWTIGASEVWLELAFMGHPVSLASALALESLSQAITGLGFLVPAAIGVQEGAYMAIGAALGLPVETALAVSLVKRVRQIVLGVPALCSWQALELHHLLAPAPSESVVPRSVPSSASNAYVRRFMRALLQPLTLTSLTPNAITWARIITGVGACAFCAIGGGAADHGAALLWLVSTLLDRGDGEFARMTQRCSERGRLLDYRGDVIVNALIFLAIGVNLRHTAWGNWSMALGVVAFLAVAGAGMLAEALELRIGRKTVPSCRGFDFDDIIFVLVPILWLGYFFPLLVGAALGGGGAVAYLWYRLTRHSEPATLVDA